MVIVSLDHLCKCFLGCLTEFGTQLVGWLLPPGEFLLGQNAHLVHVVEHTFVLHPMETGNRGVQVLHHPDGLVDIRCRLCCSINGIAELHGLDAGQTHRLAIQHKTLTCNLKFTEAKVIADLIVAWNRKSEVVKMWAVEMPKLHLVHVDRGRELDGSFLFRESDSLVKDRFASLSVFDCQLSLDAARMLIPKTDVETGFSCRVGKIDLWGYVYIS